MKRILLALALLAGTAHADIALNPDVTPDTIRATICTHGWTATVRPSKTYTNKIKRALMEAAGIDWSHELALELDHFLPIEDGGSPTDPANLRLQTWAPESPWPGIDGGAHLKDVIETKISRLICAGTISLAEGQSCITDDWRACALKHPSKGRTK